MALVEMSDILKSFGGTIAVDRVSLSLEAGSVHALMGENGAGKSTLMKILAGVYRPDLGEIRKNGAKVFFSNPREALASGISTVFQEMSLLPNLTIAENMFLGREPIKRFGGIDYSKMNKATADALRALSLDLDPETLVSNLSIAQRQFVEIAHGIEADASVFILDEPTAALNAADVEVLNKHIRRLKEEGKAIVYISHRMEEIFAICDTVTVLKDGRLVGTRQVSEMTPKSLIAMMVGRELQDLFPPRGTPAGTPVLKLDQLRLTSTSRPFDLTVRKGEIVGLAGLEGQGQQQILRALIGQYRPHGGGASINGVDLPLPVPQQAGVRKLQALKVGFVPEDRKGEGLFLGLPIAHNIAIRLHANGVELSRAKSHRDEIAHAMSSMSIKAAGMGTGVGKLSGGNQQKVLLGRYLAADTDLLLIEEPTRGVDVGAKSEIYGLLRQFADKGGAVLVLSRETLELIGLCDRIYVVHGFTVVAEMRGERATEHDILDAALSASAA